MGQGQREQQARHIERNEVWLLYSMNKERRGAKDKRRAMRNMVAEATNINIALDDAAPVPPHEAALTPEEPEDDETAEHDDGDWLQNTPEEELRRQVEMERAQEHGREGERENGREDTESDCGPQEEQKDTIGTGPPRHLDSNTHACT